MDSNTALVEAEEHTLWDKESLDSASKVDQSIVDIGSFFRKLGAFLAVIRVAEHACHNDADEVGAASTAVTARSEQREHWLEVGEDDYQGQDWHDKVKNGVEGQEHGPLSIGVFHAASVKGAYSIDLTEIVVFFLSFSPHLPVYTAPDSGDYQRYKAKA